MTRTRAARRTKDRLAARLVRARTQGVREKGLQAYRTVLDMLSNYRRVGWRGAAMVHRRYEQVRSCAYVRAKLCQWGSKLESDGVALGSKRVQGRENSNETTLFFHSSYGGDRPSITMYWRSVSLRDNCIDFPLYSIGA